MTTTNNDASTLEDGRIFGYPVVSATGCFMSPSASLGLTQAMASKEDYFETLIADMDKTFINAWSWLNRKYGEGNLIAFSSGFGDGVHCLCQIRS